MVLVTVSARAAVANHRFFAISTIELADKKIVDLLRTFAVFSPFALGSLFAAVKSLLADQRRTAVLDLDVLKFKNSGVFDIGENICNILHGESLAVALSAASFF